jgi:phosphoglucosamine mutase
VLRAGVIPTPAIAFLTAELDADFGVVLSASHNPMPDNGIKLFGRGGRKLPDQVEDAVEARAAHLEERPVGAAIGRVRDLPDATPRYVEHLLTTVTKDLAGLHVVVDCANGAASTAAPEVYRRAGARVTTIHAEPDGLNINDGCGSTHLEPVIDTVRSSGADIGVAHDGDADRCLAVTADGELVDGDAMLAICASALHEKGGLREDTVVATVMSNLGFHHAMREAGISVITTPVGDRYVLEALVERGLSLGGEQSGHLVFPDLASTGDGILTALQLLARMADTGRSLADLASMLTRLPQVLINVKVTDRTRVAGAPEVGAALADAELRLGDDGRVLIRPSGTEQLVRVMVEAPTHEEAQVVAESLAAVVATC